jgi:hypothetical protein
LQFTAETQPQTPTGFAQIVSDIHASQSGCCSSPAPASNHLFGDVSVAMTTSAAVYSIAKHGVQASERITPREPPSPTARRQKLQNVPLITVDATKAFWANGIYLPLHKNT